MSDHLPCLPLLAALAIPFAVTSVYAQRGNVEVAVDWCEGATNPLDPGIKQLMVRRFTYPSGFKGSPAISGKEEALCQALEQRIRQQITMRRPGVQVLRVDVSALLVEQRENELDRGGRAQDVTKVGDAFIVATVSPQTDMRRQSTEKSFGEKALDGVIRRRSGGLVPTGGVHKLEERRTISVVCNISLFDHTGRSLCDYTETLTESEESRRSIFGADKTSLDFDDEVKVYQHLIGEHADEFVDRLVGFTGKKSFVLQNASRDCSRAANAYGDGEYSNAMRIGVTRWQDGNVDHQAGFIAALAYAKLAKTDEAKRLCTQVIGVAMSKGADASSYQEFRDYLDAPPAGSGSGGGDSKPTPTLSPTKEGVVSRVPAKPVEATGTVGTAPPMTSAPPAAHAIALVPAELHAKVDALARSRLQQAGVDEPTPNQLDNAVRVIISEALQKLLDGK